MDLTAYGLEEPGIFLCSVVDSLYREFAAWTQAILASRIHIRLRSLISTNSTTRDFAVLVNLRSLFAIHDRIPKFLIDTICLKALNPVGIVIIVGAFVLILDRFTSKFEKIASEYSSMSIH